jgi:hypothetical protein
MKSFAAKLYFVLSMLAATSSLPVFGQVFMIDNFEGNLFLHATNAGPTQTSNDTGVVGVLQGERLSSITRDVGTGAISSFSELASGFDGDNHLSVTNAPSSQSVVNLTYGNSGMVSFNFSAYVASGKFSLVDWVSDEHALGDYVKVDLTLFSGVNSATQTVNLTKYSADPDFALSSFAGIDFSAIDKIALACDTFNVGADYSLDSFVLVAIPEPSTYSALVAAAILGYVGGRRRRSTAAH